VHWDTTFGPSRLTHRCLVLTSARALSHGMSPSRPDASSSHDQQMALPILSTGILSAPRSRLAVREFAQTLVSGSQVYRPCPCPSPRNKSYSYRRLHTSRPWLRTTQDPYPSNGGGGIGFGVASTGTDPVHGLSPELQRARERLLPVIESLPGPIDWAVAYGSGVIHQANAAPSSVRPHSTSITRPLKVALTPCTR
jgi:hypothetical protein